MKRLRLRRAFTLLELVVVLAILVILAGIVVAKLDVFQLRANKGTAASNITGVGRLVQTFYVTNNLYPNGFDSLITDRTANTLWTAPDEASKGLIPSLVGGPTPGAPTKLTTTTIATTSELYGLTRVGVSTVYDLNPTLAATANSTLPGNCFTVAHTLAVNDVVATPNPNDSNGRKMLRALYPQFDPDGTKTAAQYVAQNFRVALFGLGRLNELVGDKGLLMEAPFYANTPDRLRHYDRFLVAFDMPSSGRARLLGVFAADGDTLGEEIDDFYKIN